MCKQKRVGELQWVVVLEIRTTPTTTRPRVLVLHWFCKQERVGELPQWVAVLEIRTTPRTTRPMQQIAFVFKRERPMLPWCVFVYAACQASTILTCQIGAGWFSEGRGTLKSFGGFSPPGSSMLRFVFRFICWEVPFLVLWRCEPHNIEGPRESEAPRSDKLILPRIVGRGACFQLILWDRRSFLLQIINIPKVHKSNICFQVLQTLHRCSPITGHGHERPPRMGVVTFDCSWKWNGPLAVLLVTHISCATAHSGRPPSGVAYKSNAKSMIRVG